MPAWRRAFGGAGVDGVALEQVEAQLGAGIAPRMGDWAATTLPTVVATVTAFLASAATVILRVSL
ncbi:MAG: hypothetical protein AcusKO_08500 [Acuticoccus sp.]